MNWVYALIIFKRISSQKVVRRIPIKSRVHTPDEIVNSKWIKKIVVWNTEKFKLKGNNTFLTLKEDTNSIGSGWIEYGDYSKYRAFRRADDFLPTLISQGSIDGWYRPRDTMISHVLINKKKFYKKYQQFNLGVENGE